MSAKHWNITMCRAHSSTERILTIEMTALSVRNKFKVITRDLEFFIVINSRTLLKLCSLNVLKTTQLCRSHFLLKRSSASCWNTILLSNTIQPNVQ